MANLVVEKLSSLLTDYINDKSDNSPMEATQQEIFEKGFKEFIENLRPHPEMLILELMNEMCDKSLPPNLHDYWLIVAKCLSKTRSGMVLENELKSMADKAIERRQKNALEYLKLVAKDSGETPDMQDVNNVLDIL